MVYTADFSSVNDNIVNELNQRAIEKGGSFSRTIASMTFDEFQNFLKGVGYFFKDTQTFEVLDHDASAKEKVLTPTDEEIAEEVSRLRSMTMGLSEEALLMSAHINLGNKKN